MILRAASLLTALILLSGCAPLSVFPFSKHAAGHVASKAFQTRTQSALVDQTVTAIHDRDFTAFREVASEDLLAVATKEKFEDAVRLVPEGALLMRASLLHRRNARSNGGDMIRSSYTLEEHWFRGGRAFIEITLLEKDGDWRLDSFFISPIDEAAVSANLFTLEGKTPFHYGMLGLAGLSMFLVISAMIAIGSMHGLKRRIPWFLFAAVSFYPVTMNWTTGGIAPPFFAFTEAGLRFQLFKVILFGADYAKQTYGPAFLSVGFPLGALLFWICYFTGSLRFKEAAKA